MIKDTDGESYESIRSTEQNLTFSEAEKFFAAMSLAFEYGQKKTLGLLSKDDMYTNLAHLISDQCKHTIKLAVFSGTEKISFQDRKEFTGSILKQLQDCYAVLERYNSLRSEIQGLIRIDKRDYPEDTIREALLNAVVHRDYSYSAPTLVSIFDDRVEIVSLGGLAKGVTLNDLLMGVSVAQNEKLSNVFYRLNLIEAYGTGIPKIMHSYEKSPVTPKIETSDNAFKITLPNMNTPLKSEALPLREEECLTLEFAENRKSFTRQELQDALAFSQTKAIRIIKNLLEKGLLQMTGAGKNIKYKKR